MSRMKKFIEKQKKLSRFQALKSIFSSLLMTVAVVVVVTIAVPKSPKAEIFDLDIFTNQIVYSINVTDSESAIKEDTLFVELKNQSEVYTYPLNIGDNTGVISELSENTEYTIRVLADKGFGPEVLDKETFVTYDKTGGAFTEIDLISEPDNFELDYMFGLFINDPFDEYIGFQIRYGFKYQQNDEILEYFVSPINKTDTEFIMRNVFNENVEVHIYLEAVNINSEIIELDYMVFNTPYKIYASFYLNQISYDLLSVLVYPEYPEGIEAEYEVVLMRNYTIEEKVTLEQPVMDEEHHHFMSTVVEFDRLKQNVEYTLILNVNYRNPYTLVFETQELYIENFITLEKPVYDLEVIETDDSYEVIISVDEPLNSFNTAYYTIYQDSEFGYFIYNSDDYNFEYYDNQYHLTMYISKPLMLSDFKIEIGFKDSMNFSNYSVIYTDEYHEEVE